jgi:hypothetical protein
VENFNKTGQFNSLMQINGSEDVLSLWHPRHLEITVDICCKMYFLLLSYLAINKKIINS